MGKIAEIQKLISDLQTAITNDIPYQQAITLADENLYLASNIEKILDDNGNIITLKINFTKDIVNFSINNILCMSLTYKHLEQFKDLLIDFYKD